MPTPFLVALCFLALSATIVTGGSTLSRDSRIAIVGAGPAGMHMAYLLQSLGFTNLLVLEASNRVGGRSLTLQADGLAHELGTCYLTRDYTELRQMAQAMDYDLEERIIPEATLRLADGSRTTLQAFVADRIRRLDPHLTPESPNSMVALRVYQATQRYLALRAGLLGLRPNTEDPDYLELPLEQPRADALASMNCTIQQFLQRYGLMPLEPYFLLGQTAMGYGSLEDTSVLYGFMWMTPGFLQDLQGPREKSQLTMLNKGFQAFWEAARDRLQRRGGVQFRLNSRVASVTRRPNGIDTSDGAVRLQLAMDYSGSSSTAETVAMETVDWLVWTPSMKAAIDRRIFADLTRGEADVFGRLRERRFRTRLVRLPGQPPVAADPVIYYLSQLDTVDPSLNRLLAVRNTNLALNSTALSHAPTDPTTSTVVAYYLSAYADEDSNFHSPPACNSCCHTTDEATLEAGNTVADVNFAYMPRFSPSDLADGLLWRLLNRVQGSRRTWFTGHSAVFDSVKSVMKYNKMLLSMRFPQLADRLREI